MICVLADDALLVHGSQKKLDFLRASADASAAAGQPVRLRLLPREKGDATVAANRSALDALLAAVAAAGNKLATFPQDRQEGAMAQGWQQELAAAGVALEDGLRGFVGARNCAATRARIAATSRRQLLFLEWWD